MRDTKASFFTTPTFEGDGIHRVSVHAYTTRRKLAISLWLIAFAASALATFLCFDIPDTGGANWLLILDVGLMSDLRLGTHHYHTIISLYPVGQVVGFILTVLLGIKVLIAFVPPPVHEHRLRIRTTSVPEETHIL